MIIFFTGERPFFYPGFDKENIWTLSNPPPVDDIFKMEANFMLFRDYTLINIMMLQTMVNIYRDDTNLPNARALKGQYLNQVNFEISLLNLYPLICFSASAVKHFESR